MQAKVRRFIKGVLGEQTIQATRHTWRWLRWEAPYRGLPLTPDQRKLLALKNSYAGRRCFIIGNGPSLKQTPLDALKNEVTIGCNGLFLLFDQTDFRPTFYTIEDPLVAEDRAGIVNAMRGIPKIFPQDLAYCLHPDAETCYVNFIRDYWGFPRFSPHFERVAYWGGTVTFMNLQLAYYLGCREVYLVGIDHNYQQAAPQDEQQGTVITSHTADVNHFHPDYFGPGYRWHDPKVERMEQAYWVARHFFESQGGVIYNATVGGQLKVFPRVDYNQVVSRSV